MYEYKMCDFNYFLGIIFRRKIFLKVFSLEHHNQGKTMRIRRSRHDAYNKVILMKNMLLVAEAKRTTKFHFSEHDEEEV